MKLARIVLPSLAALLFAQPALADGGLSAAVILTAAKYTLKFLSAASSNANAVVEATAVSKAGTDHQNDSDTGFFSATAETTATSGNLAQQTSFAYDQYNFLSPNVEKVRYTPRALYGNGISITPIATTKIKGVWQILIQTILPLANTDMAAAPIGDFIVPISLQYDLDGHSSYNFDVSLEGGDGTIIDLANGMAGVGGSSINLPLLQMTDPALATKVEAQYLANVSGQGPVSFYLGQGLLPDGLDGNPGLPVSFALNQAFSLNSELDGARFEAIPEPATWTIMLVGFGMMGGEMRRRNLRARASSNPRLLV
jgi:hypothetical protein